MNHQIQNLFKLSAIGFAILITLTAYWQIWAADSLAARTDNARLVYRQLQIKRGLIFAANGTTALAQNRKATQDGQTIYTRRYPLGGLFAQVVGYNSVNQGRTGLELSYNDFLTSSNSNLSTQLHNLGDSLSGQTITGNNVITSLSVPAQKAAVKGLGSLHGAVVAIQPSTGRVLAMASSPSFNPNNVTRNFAKLNRPNSGAPLLNRATQGLYIPGSTFKTVTSTAALKSGLYTPTSPLTPAPACLTVYGRSLCNAGNESYPYPIDLTTALTYSINTVFAQIGAKLGQQRMRATMSQFGFFQKPAIDLPSDEVAASGLYNNGKPLSSTTPLDLQRTAMGQGYLQVTPLQMAEVAATIANGGTLMQPSLVDRAVSPGGSTVYRHHPETVARVMSNQTSQELTGMMQKVVDEGTGEAAQIGGLPVAGKTGTAETGVPGIYTPWFIAFAPGAPGDTPKIAVAVVIDRSQEFGGQIAAPIAADVIKAYLGTNLAQ